MEVIPLKYGVVFKRVFSNPAVFQHEREQWVNIYPHRKLASYFNIMQLLFPNIS